MVLLSGALKEKLPEICCTEKEEATNKNKRKYIYHKKKVEKSMKNISESAIINDHCCGDHVKRITLGTEKCG